MVWAPCWQLFTDRKRLLRFNDSHRIQTEAHSRWIIEKWICRSHMFLCLTCAPLLAHLHHTQTDKTGGRERSALWRQRRKQSHRTVEKKTQTNWEQVRATHATNHLMKLWWEKAGKTTQTGSVKHNQKNERGALKINRKQQTNPKQVHQGTQGVHQFVFVAQT